jgi:hypothetical protein
VALVVTTHQLRLMVVEQRTREMNGQGQPVTDMDRGQALWGLLVEAIERLHSSGEQTVTTLAWRRYLALRRGYVDGWTNLQVAKELNVGLRTLDRDRNAGAEALADAVWQMEETLRDEMAQGGASI